MARKCSICKLPETIRAEVDRMLGERTASLTEIAEQFAPRRHGAPKLSRSALDRHRRRCMARTEALAALSPAQAKALPAEQNRLLAITDSVRTRLEALLPSVVGFLENGESFNDAKTGLGAVREARKLLELIAKISGELSTVTTAIQVNQTSAQPPPDFSSMTVPQLRALKALTRLARGEGLDRLDLALLARLEDQHA